MLLSLFRSYVTSPSSYLCAGGSLLFYFAFSFLYISIHRLGTHISSSVTFFLFHLIRKTENVRSRKRKSFSRRKRSNIRTYAYIKTYAAIYQSTLLHSFSRCIYILGILSFLFFIHIRPLIFFTKREKILFLRSIILYFSLLSRGSTHTNRRKKTRKSKQSSNSQI